MVEVRRNLALIRPRDLVKLAVQEEVEPGHSLTCNEALRTLLAELIIVTAEELLLEVDPVVLESSYRARVRQLRRLFLIDLRQGCAADELGSFTTHILEEGCGHGLEHLTLCIIFRLKDLASLRLSLHNPLEEQLAL